MDTFSYKAHKMQNDLDKSQEALSAGLRHHQILKFLELDPEQQQECINYMNYLKDTGKDIL